MIELLNNNKYVFGPNRPPIIQFSIENRRALQLQEQRRERMKTKSKSEIRDDTDRMIAKSRNKTPLPQKTKKKWFE